MDNLIASQVLSALRLGEQYLQYLFPFCPDGILTIFSNTAVDQDSQYKMTPNNTALPFFTLWGQSEGLFPDENDICFFPSILGLLFMSGGINESWGYADFGGIITWDHKNDEGLFIPFCSEIFHSTLLEEI